MRCIQHGKLAWTPKCLVEAVWEPRDKCQCVVFIIEKLNTLKLNYCLMS